MVVINPGGGVQLDGSDGLQSVFNGAQGYKPAGPGLNVPQNGSDQQFFARTGQWCCAGTAPNIYVGATGFGTLIGNGGAAITGTALNWDTVEIISTSGSAVRAPTGTTTLPATPTGDGGVVIRYSKTISDLLYVAERTISYQYPNSYYSESWTFTIPEGNTDPVQFYQGGDAAPGDSDSGRGMMTTSPQRVLYEINEYSGIFIAYGEVPGGSLIDHWFVGHYSSPWAGMRNGQNLNDTVNTGGHDAGMDMQWTIPASPGSYTRNMQTTVNFQNTSLSASFSDTEITSAETSNLQIELVNSLFTPAESLGFTFGLPPGLSIAGAGSSDCGGTFTAAGTEIELSAASILAASNCTVTVPVQGPAGEYTINDQDFTVSGALTKNYGVSSLTITAAPPVFFDLVVSKSGTGSGTVNSSPSGIDCGADCSESIAGGTEVTLTATPATGSTFTGWNGAGCSGTSTCTVTMSEARAVNAEFAVVPPGSFNLAITKSGTGAGTVTSSPAGIDCGSDCSETLVDGTSVTLTASPTTGSSFAGWSGSGCSGSSTCTVVMSEARAVTAEFTAAPPPPPPPPKPSNVFPTPKVKAGASALASRVHVPGPGTITQRVTRSSNLAAVLTVCKTSGKATKAGWVKLTCKLSKATRTALRQRSLRVSVKTTFTPTGGLPASKTQVVTLKSQRPPPYTG